ncbi:MAG: hypothetical protein HRU12_16920 [Phaeodactylibacter sp.]|nr:hypothetical protein [Phaeodactylibacter sp.]
MKTIALTFDVVMQALLLIGFICVPFTIFFAFPLGVWQLSSSLFKGMLLRSFLHFYYSFSAIAYCIVLFLGANYIDFPDGFLGRAPEYLWIVFCLPPAVGAFWYFWLSIKDLDHSKIAQRMV